MMNTFDFISSIYDSIAQRADRLGVSSLSKAERTVLFACWGKSEVDNGGFAQLYSTPVGIDDVVEAFRSIGLTEAADVFAHSKLVFPEALPHHEVEARRDFVDSLLSRDEDVDPWEEDNHKIWNLEQAQFDDAVSKFVDSHSVDVKG